MESEWPSAVKEAAHMLAMSRKNTSWTKERDRQLVRAARAVWASSPEKRSGRGLTSDGFRSVAARLGYSSGEGVRRRAGRIKLDARPWWKRMLGGA